MKLTKYRLGNFVELYNERCGNANLTAWDISGINSDKEFFEPARQVGSDTSNYKVVPPNYFACNLMHVGRDRVLPIALNHTSQNKIVSPAYTIFKITDDAPVVRDYFFIMLKSSEKDRFFWLHTDSSVRDGMSWNDFCDMDIELPSRSVQQKYVAIYNAMLENQRCYGSALEDLKLICDAYIEELSKDYQSVTIGQFIFQRDLRNDGSLGVSSVRGIATSKEFINTKADMEGVGLNNYKVVAPGQFAYVPDTSRRGDKISLALNTSENTYLVSSISIVFDTQKDVLLPEYLMLFFGRSEFDRYARFHSWGSARETFDWFEMCDVQIPIPDIKIQQYIVNIYTAYLLRKEINEQLKAQVKNVCPILIKGSLEEAENG